MTVDALFAFVYGPSTFFCQTFYLYIYIYIYNGLGF